ncbi:MAG: hypothetical protein CTY18_08175 [Methylomonas sp.]|nr:MAG: hypothetical protein CTY18_08175 [Methylomonas sp.]
MTRKIQFEYAEVQHSDHSHYPAAVKFYTPSGHEKIVDVKAGYRPTHQTQRTAYIPKMSPVKPAACAGLEVTGWRKSTVFLYKTPSICPPASLAFCVALMLNHDNYYISKLGSLRKIPIQF